MGKNSFEYSVRSTTRDCVHCGGVLEEGECNLRNGDETDVYWFCPSCEWDERDDGLDYDFEWNDKDQKGEKDE